MQVLPHPLLFATALACAQASASPDYHRARWDPIHFPPAIRAATDAQCLACHREVLENRVRERSPAGVEAAGLLAGYQRTTTYAGGQETFHRRHLATPLARSLMRLRCNSCHDGSDPREKAPAAGDLRRSVSTGTACLRCHGRMDWRLMGLPGPWESSAAAFGANCLVCHATVRTHRHRVDDLDAEAIEKAAAADPQVCYGCHGGRAWYRVAFPYARHPWPGMPSETPDWARTRPAPVH